MQQSPMTVMSSGFDDHYTPFYLKEFASSSSSLASKPKIAEIKKKLASTEAGPNRMNNGVGADQNGFGIEHRIPERLQPLLNANITDRECFTTWIAEFMPRPEPPRFFRPLCSRLKRHNQVLRERDQSYTEKINKDIAEARRRLNMTIRQVRDEQKAQLKEKYRKAREERISKSCNKQRTNGSMKDSRQPNDKQKDRHPNPNNVKQSKSYNNGFHKSSSAVSQQ